MTVLVTGQNLGTNSDNGGIVFIKVDDSVLISPIASGASSFTF